jgi:Na+/proline symporter/nitrogen-specific signal transduction histidine kinase
MSLSFNLMVAICLAYVAFLFGVAAWAERAAQRSKKSLLHSPIVYTLSISVYCTAWTYFGAVGSAARSGLEFLPIYLGPTLVFVGWWWFLRKLVRIGRTQRITSIADLISSRYGKSNVLAIMVTVLAVIASTPYIALQLQSLTLSFAVFTEPGSDSAGPDVTAFVIAIGLAFFTILFGTRNLDANERHHGVVTAIAIEACVKLIALIAVGVFVVWHLGDGINETLELVERRLPQNETLFTPRWVTLTFLSATAIICLPRMFQVVVVENSAEKHLATASWAFPLYLFLMCLFVVPIAVTGLEILPEGSNPDLFVLTLPLSQNQDALAALAFLGGFSSATSMVIVAAIALSTMVSNHIALPLWLYGFQKKSPASDDVRSVLLFSRRFSIAAILGLGYLYYVFTSGETALASIGLIAFLGVAQVLPAMVGGMFWRNATRTGAIWGISVGFLFWAYTLFLPSIEGGEILSATTLSDGLFGLNAFRPQALFGSHISDPLTHATFWSLTGNILAFIIGSLASTPKPLERLQGIQFINIFAQTVQNRATNLGVTSEDLFVLAQRILGREEAAKVFRQASDGQGKPTGLPDPTGGFIETLEKELAGSVGAATAHAMITQISGGVSISVDELIAVADETAQIMEYSAELETKSAELQETAAKLRVANDKLTAIGQQKDDFLSQVSHELRTPMTSIRSFSELLKSDSDLEPGKLNQFATIINDESLRLTRLLDEILDLSVLEHGNIRLNMGDTLLRTIWEKAIATTQHSRPPTGTDIQVNEDFMSRVLNTDGERLTQVLINLITNSFKYSGSSNLQISVSGQENDNRYMIDFLDNGAGIPDTNHNLIFEKFSRLEAVPESLGVGLGLPISREIMRNLGGDIVSLPSTTGAKFQLWLPLEHT